MFKLADIQARFHALVTAPEDVARTLQDRGMTAADLAPLVRGDERLPAAARLDIYANMYFFRILDVLRDAYPKTASILGEVPFHNLITDYLIACPPAHPSIGRAGDRLPDFLARHPLGIENPTLAPLARLELAYVHLHDGPDAATLTAGDLKKLSPGDLAARPLRLIPCHQILRSGGSGETVLVWRQNFTVYHRAVGTGEAELLSMAAAGTTVAALGDHASRGQPEMDAARQVFQLVHRWADDGVLAA